MQNIGDKTVPKNAQMDTIGNDKVQDGEKKTNFEKYGVENPSKLQKKLIKASQEKFPYDDSDEDEVPELVESGRTFQPPPRDVIKKRLDAIRNMYDAIEDYPDMPNEKKEEVRKDLVLQSMMASVPDNVSDMKASDMRAEMVNRVMREIKAMIYMAPVCQIIIKDPTFRNVKKEVLARLTSEGFMNTEVDSVDGITRTKDIKLTW